MFCVDPGKYIYGEVIEEDIEAKSVARVLPLRDVLSF